MSQHRINTCGWLYIKMVQSIKNGCGTWLAVSLFLGGTAEHTRKIVIARSVLETLTWLTESTFKLNNCVTQLINHYETLNRGGQAKTGEMKVMKLLNSIILAIFPFFSD